MLSYAYPDRCPDCRATLAENPPSCPSCELPLRGPLAQELFRTLERADELLRRLRTETTHVAPAPPPAPVPVMIPEPFPAPAAASPRRTGLRTASVPTILLSLGALCLLVAAITFLVVTWSWLGVAGRTAVLVGLTVVAAGTGVVLDRRGLRIAAESLTVVALGLMALDVVGAIAAGWLGTPDSAASAALVGGGVTVLSGALLTRCRLIAPELGVAVGLMLTLVGASVTTGHHGLVAFIAVLALATAAGLGLMTGARVLFLTAAPLAAAWWGWLLVAGLQAAFSDPSLAGLWTSRNALPLLGAAALLLAPAVAPYQHAAARAACASGAATIVTLLLALPAIDEGPAAVAGTLLVGLVAWVTVAATISRRVAWGPLVLVGGPALAFVTFGLVNAVVRVGSVDTAFATTAGVRLDAPSEAATPLLLVPLVAALLAAAWAATPLRWNRNVAVVVLVVAAAATVASYAVPLAAVVGILALAALVALRLRQPYVAVAFVVAMVTAGLPSAVLTLAACAVAVTVAVVLLRAEGIVSRSLGGMLLPVSVAGLVWSGAEVAGVAVDLRALPVLLLVGALAIAMPRVRVEASAVSAGLVAALGSLDAAPDQPNTLIILLTVAGALVTVSSVVHEDRRVLAWPGAALLAAAIGVRTADVGVMVTTAAVAVALAALLLAARNALGTLVGGMLLPVASAALVWSGAAVADLPVDQRALPVLMVLGLLAIARPRIEVEATAALAGLSAASASLAVTSDQPTTLAVQLTLAGALVTVSSLVHQDRRYLAWPGGILLAAATWVRLADLGVEAPEPYTLPSAVVLILVALHRLWRTPGTSTAVLLPGLTLGTVPSLLWVLVDPVSPRAVLLGLACLGLVLAGAQLRWSAPLAVGALVGGMLVLREVAPYAGEMPQWVLIGLAGTLLTVVGVTWERRVLEMRRATAYLGRLR